MRSDIIAELCLTAALIRVVSSSGNCSWKNNWVSLEGGALEPWRREQKVISIYGHIWRVLNSTGVEQADIRLIKKNN